MLAAINNEEEVKNTAVLALHDAKGILIYYPKIFYRYAEKYPECIHAINKYGWSALLFAAKNGNAHIVEVNIRFLCS